MPDSLKYYCHRWRDKDPSVQRWNLLEAKRRFRETSQWISGVLWAPWLTVAERGVDEAVAWHVIECSIAASDGIVLDLDGGEMSDEMRREREIAEILGKSVEALT
jgi:hypothetical protein